ncbi:MAG: NAD(P)H-dependent oxidoreductase [Anaerolineae bacterium]|nr:NAD(P)H-dependent oxidoreductase [Anaerolineae bacterium]
MNITCISAANVARARDHSASTRACEIIRDLVTAEYDAQVEILPLLDYELTPCLMCGQCLTAGECVYDPAFNALHARLAAADAVFVVCPHYAPLPSKLMMLLEKLEEICYLNWCQNQEYHTVVYGKPIGLVAHGGQTAEALPYYKTALLDPLALAFASVQMRVMSAGPEWPNGAVFGVQRLYLPPGDIFVQIEHDWDDIRQHLTPLVINLLAQLQAAR